MSYFHLSAFSGKPNSASGYLDYITRGMLARRGLPTPDLKGCFSGNLPAWSKGDPRFFFRMADENERLNGAAYRAYEISLPRELTWEQNIAMVLNMIPELIGPRPWFMAVHDSVSKLSGEPNPHVHLMYSDRACDGIPRTPEQYFGRANPWHPELGGAPKLSGGKPPSQMGAELRAVREWVAARMNSELCKHGHEARVDHRSYKERGLNSQPEVYLGKAAVELMNEQQRAALFECRWRSATTTTF